MAVAFVLEIAGVTPQQIEAFNQRITPGGRAPEGQVFHAGGPTETGWVVVDVWESQEAFQRFVEMATPIAQELGIPTNYQIVRMIQVHDILKP
jgi:hypothetical protein